MASQAIERVGEMNRPGYICVNDVSKDFKGLDRLTISSHPTESVGLFEPLANLFGRHGEQSLNQQTASLIDALLAHAFAHSDTAARQARKIAVALQQWPNKTEAGKAHERKKIREDMLALSAMMRGQA